MASTRVRNFALLAVIGLGSAGAAFFLASSRKVREARDAVPANAFLVAEVNVERLRGSAWADLARAGASAGVPALAQVAGACGWDLMARVREFVLALPDEGGGAFGIVATTDVRPDEIAACTEKLVAARGGHGQVTTRGAFHVLRDQAKPDGSAIAYGLGGLVVVGSGLWFEAMLDTAEGKTPSARTGDHASLRSAVAGHDGPVAVASVLLPDATRARVRREMGLATADAREDVAMAAVLAVRTAGAAVSVGKKSEGAELRLELRCETAAACSEVKTLLEQKRLAWSQDLRLRLFGAGPLVDSLDVKVEGTKLLARAGIAADDLTRLVERAKAFSGVSDLRRPAAKGAALPHPTPPSVDEIVRPSGSPSGAPRGRP